MNKSLKIAIATAVVLVALGCFSFAFASSQGYLFSSNNQLATNQQISQFLSTHQEVAVGAFGRFMNHAQLSEVTGTVVCSESTSIFLLIFAYIVFIIRNFQKIVSSRKPNQGIKLYTDRLIN